MVSIGHFSGKWISKVWFPSSYWKSPGNVCEDTSRHHLDTETQLWLEFLRQWSSLEQQSNVQDNIALDCSNQTAKLKLIWPCILMKTILTDGGKLRCHNCQKLQRVKYFPTLKNWNYAEHNRNTLMHFTINNLHCIDKWTINRSEKRRLK